MKTVLAKSLVSVAALSMAVAPAVAQVSAASKLSTRAVTKSEKKSDISNPPIIALLGIAGIIAGGIIIATDDNDPDSP